MDLDKRIETVKQNSGSSIKKYGKWVLLAIVGLWAWSGYNGLVKAEEPIANAWGNVETEYQARVDKVAVISKIVKNAANFEQQTLTDVIEARSKATSINLDVNDLTPENMAKFQQAQQGLSGALNKLMVVSERYPDLKASQQFIGLQSQLEGTENRINVERNRFNNMVISYNTMIRKFPKNITANMFSFEKMEYFKADPAASKAPEVKF